MFKKFMALLLVVFLGAPVAAEPLRLTITDGVIEPLPYAIPTFQAEIAGSEDMAANISRVIAEDLSGTGLFRQSRPRLLSASTTLTPRPPIPIGAPSTPKP